MNAGERIYDVLDALCRDSIECSLEQALAQRDRPDLGEITALYIEAYDACSATSYKAAAAEARADQAEEALRQYAKPSNWDDLTIGVYKWVGPGSPWDAAAAALARSSSPGEEETG